MGGPSGSKADEGYRAFFNAIAKEEPFIHGKGKEGWPKVAQSVMAAITNRQDSRKMKEPAATALASMLKRTMEEEESYQEDIAGIRGETGNPTRFAAACGLSMQTLAARSVCFQVYSEHRLKTQKAKEQSEVDEAERKEREVATAAVLKKAMAKAVQSENEDKQAGLLDEDTRKRKFEGRGQAHTGNKRKQADTSAHGAVFVTPTIEPYGWSTDEEEPSLKEFEDMLADLRKKREEYDAKQRALQIQDRQEADKALASALSAVVRQQTSGICLVLAEALRPANQLLAQQSQVLGQQSQVLAALLQQITQNQDSKTALQMGPQQQQPT